MPTYDYKCDACHAIAEYFKKMNDPTVEECLWCGGTARRQISGGAGVHFKGSGFYETDYKHTNNNTPPNSD